MSAREAVVLFALRLPDGKWWRRGTGTRDGGPTPSLRWATQYKKKCGAVSAAMSANLDENHGGYKVIEIVHMVGDEVAASRK